MRRDGRRSAAGAATAVVLALATGASPAAAACSAPVVPDAAGLPARPSVPVKGPCVDAKPGTAGCTGPEPYRFNEDVKTYNARLAAWKPAADAYLAKLNAYVQASADYARCEVRAMQP